MGVVVSLILLGTVVLLARAVSRLERRVRDLELRLPSGGSTR